MARFRKDPDPRFWRLNRSLPFDWQLAAYDLDQSRAHARGLQQLGVLSAGEAEQIVAGLERVREGLTRPGFQFEDGDEDVHMAVERLLGEEVGPLAGKLHTGRSRNDQVATDVAMVVQAHSLRAVELLGSAMGRLLEQAESHKDWPMPGYTHLQRAQPVYLGHHLLAYFWMLARDVLRFQFALDSASVMPLGSGALAGVNWEIDRGAVADDLGFEHVTANSIERLKRQKRGSGSLRKREVCLPDMSRRLCRLHGAAEGGAELGNHALDLGLAHRRVEGQRQRARRGRFGDRELALAVAELAQVREEMDAGQVGLGGDAALGEAGDRRVAVGLGR